MFMGNESLPKDNISFLTLMDKEKHYLIGHNHQTLKNIALELMIRLWGQTSRAYCVSLTPLQFCLIFFTYGCVCLVKIIKLKIRQTCCREDSAVKSTCCFSRGLKFGSQHITTWRLTITTCNRCSYLRHTFLFSFQHLLLKIPFYTTELITAYSIWLANGVPVLTGL